MWNSRFAINRVTVSQQRCKYLILFLVVMSTLAGAAFRLSGAPSPPAARTQEPVSQPAETSPKAQDDLEHLRQTVKRLTAENEKLRKRVADLEHRQQLGSIQDRLTNEEQRAENLQVQLLTAAEREAAVQSRLDEINDQLRPESLNSMVVGGSTRPEAVRESARRRLENERVRLQSQLDLLHQSRARLQASLASTDLTIQQLRLQVQQAAH